MLLERTGKATDIFEADDSSGSDAEKVLWLTRFESSRFLRNNSEQNWKLFSDAWWLTLPPLSKPLAVKWSFSLLCQGRPCHFLSSSPLTVPWQDVSVSGDPRSSALGSGHGGLWNFTELHYQWTFLNVGCSEPCDKVSHIVNLKGLPVTLERWGMCIIQHSPS